MLYQIRDGTLSVGSKTVLNHVDFEIRGTEKIAVVGRNGAGKSTLLRLIAGELSLDADDRRQQPGIFESRVLSKGLLSQILFTHPEQTVREYIEGSCTQAEADTAEGLSYQVEFDKLFCKFGFSLEEKYKRLDQFSGGEQVKIGLIRLLLQQPDILLLDEPTNYLDLESVEWLEEYLLHYPKAVVVVSHDRFFLDQIASVVYRLDGGKLTRYVGNYTDYRRQKQKDEDSVRKKYEQQQQELAHEKELIEKFKSKPRKASFVRSRKKLAERMKKVEKPKPDDSHIFTGEMLPQERGSKIVLECENLQIGYEQALLQFSWRLRRGQKVGVIGPNGVGKSTFLKTVAGKITPLDGKCSLGNHITVGYFDQFSAVLQDKKTVLQHFQERFPAKTEKEARQILASYLFRGVLASRKVCDLSSGEKARLILCELLTECPNFLVLDEPTSHMDIPAKETLESAFRAYQGTILFVSHDRYFTSRIADELLIFEEGKARYFPFGYERYMKQKRESQNSSIRLSVDAEDAALIEGVRSVPEPEKRVSTSREETYDDWQLGLLAQQMEADAGKAKEAWEQWQEQIVFYGSGPGPFLEETTEADETEKEKQEACKASYEAACSVWLKSCLEWYDAYCESKEQE